VEALASYGPACRFLAATSHCDGGTLVFGGEPDAPSAVCAMQAATGRNGRHHELGEGATAVNLTAAGGAAVAECGGEIRCLEAVDGP
jgi:hypothetical protein